MTPADGPIAPSLPRRKTTSAPAAFLGLLSAVALFGAAVCAIPFTLMLLIGAAHSEISPAIPALGFTATAVLTAILAVCGAIWNALPVRS